MESANLTLDEHLIKDDLQDTAGKIREQIKLAMATSGGKIFGHVIIT